MSFIVDPSTESFAKLVYCNSYALLEIILLEAFRHAVTCFENLYILYMAHRSHMSHRASHAKEKTGQKLEKPESSQEAKG